METLLNDIRYALRAMVRTPGWTAMAVLTLALGTGANTAVFGFVDALLFRPAPGVRAPGGVVAVFTSDFSSGPYGDTSYPGLSVDRQTRFRRSRAWPRRTTRSSRRSASATTSSACGSRASRAGTSTCSALVPNPGRAFVGRPTPRRRARRRRQPRVLDARARGQPGAIGSTIKLNDKAGHDRRRRAAGVPRDRPRTGDRRVDPAGAAGGNPLGARRPRRRRSSGG